MVRKGGKSLKGNRKEPWTRDQNLSLANTLVMALSTLTALAIWYFS